MWEAGAERGTMAEHILVCLVSLVSFSVSRSLLNLYLDSSIVESYHLLLVWALLQPVPARFALEGIRSFQVRITDVKDECDIAGDEKLISGPLVLQILSAVSVLFYIDMRFGIETNLSWSLSFFSCHIFFSSKYTWKTSNLSQNFCQHSQWNFLICRRVESSIARKLTRCSTYFTKLKGAGLVEKQKLVFTTVTFVQLAPALSTSLFEKNIFRKFNVQSLGVLLLLRRKKCAHTTDLAAPRHEYLLSTDARRRGLPIAFSSTSLSSLRLQAEFQTKITSTLKCAMWNCHVLA